MTRFRLLLLVGALQAGACGSSPLMPPTGSGGSPDGTGGTGATGGTVGSGGFTGSGGEVARGGTGGTATGGSGGGFGTGGVPGTGGAAGSPGSVTFFLSAPPPGSYCDQISCPPSGSSQHLSITTPQGEILNINPTLCGTTDCNTCTPLLCPALGAVACPAPQGVAYTGGSWTWDGSFLQGATCGASHVSC